MEDAGLNDEPEQVLEGLERRVEPLGQSRLLGVAHVVVQDFGELPVGQNQGQIECVCVCVVGSTLWLETHM